MDLEKQGASRGDRRDGDVSRQSGAVYHRSSPAHGNRVKEVVAPVSSAVVSGGAKLADSVMAHAVTTCGYRGLQEAARHIPWGRAALVSVGLLGGVTALMVWRLLPRRPVVAIVATQQTPAGSS